MAPAGAPSGDLTLDGNAAWVAIAAAAVVAVIVCVVAVVVVVVVCCCRESPAHGVPHKEYPRGTDGRGYHQVPSPAAHAGRAQSPAWATQTNDEPHRRFQLPAAAASHASPYAAAAAAAAVPQSATTGGFDLYDSVDAMAAYGGAGGFGRSHDTFSPSPSPSVSASPVAAAPAIPVASRTSAAPPAAAAAGGVGWAGGARGKPPPLERPDGSSGSSSDSSSSGERSSSATVLASSGSTAGGRRPKPPAPKTSPEKRSRLSDLLRLRRGPDKDKDRDKDAKPGKERDVAEADKRAKGGSARDRGSADGHGSDHRKRPARDDPHARGGPGGKAAGGRKAPGTDDAPALRPALRDHKRALDSTRSVSVSIAPTPQSAQAAPDGSPRQPPWLPQLAPHAATPPAAAAAPVWGDPVAVVAVAAAAAVAASAAQRSAAPRRGSLGSDHRDDDDRDDDDDDDRDDDDGGPRDATSLSLDAIMDATAAKLRRRGGRHGSPRASSGSRGGTRSDPADTAAATAHPSMSGVCADEALAALAAVSRDGADTVAAAFPNLHGLLTGTLSPPARGAGVGVGTARGSRRGSAAGLGLAYDSPPGGPYAHPFGASLSQSHMEMDAMALHGAAPPGYAGGSGAVTPLYGWPAQPVPHQLHHQPPVYQFPLSPPPLAAPSLAPAPHGGAFGPAPAAARRVGHSRRSSSGWAPPLESSSSDASDDSVVPLPPPHRVSRRSRSGERFLEDPHAGGVRSGSGSYAYSPTRQMLRGGDRSSASPLRIGAMVRDAPGRAGGYGGRQPAMRGGWGS